MSSRWYPLYQKGNPQLRVFLSDFWMKLVKPEHALPPNRVKFICSTGMSNVDVKNYLEKIYNVPVVSVKTIILQGKTKEAGETRYIVKEDDYKVAFVTMPKDVKFEFPNLFPKSEDKETDEMRQEKLVKEEYKKRQENSRYKLRPNVPNFFGF